MAILPKQVTRYGLVLLAVAVAAACSSEGDGGTGPGSASLSIWPSSVSIGQGGSQQVTATLARAGGSQDPVNFTVTGQPAGVTVAVSNVQTSGVLTTATVTIDVGAAVAPGQYPLVLHGTGNGVGEVTQTFPLTVTIPSISLWLSSGSAYVWQGNYAYITATVSRAGGFSDSVEVTVTGLPAGVSATGYYEQTSGLVTTAYLGISVDAATVPGVYALVVHATGRGVSEATAAFTLTTTVPGFTLALSSPTLSIMQGTATPTTTVNLVRNNFTGPVTFYVDIGDSHGTMPPGVTAAWATNPVSGNSSVLTLTVGAGAVPDVYDLYIWGDAAGGYGFAVLTLTVTAP